MNCDECKELLVLDVEGLLEEAQKQAVAEHLAGCQACRAEREELGTLQQRLVANGKAVTQSNVENEVMNRIIREQNARLKAVAEASAGLRLRRLIMKSPMTKLAVAAVVLVALALGFHTFLGGGAGAAFAQVVEQLQNAQTLVYSLVTVTGQEEMPTVRTDIAFKEPGWLRTSTADGYVTVIEATDAGVTGISIVPPMKQYLEFEFSFADMADNPETGPYVSVEKLRALPAQADEMLGRKEIDGRTLEGFRVTEDDATTTVWIDPKTGELARAEMTFASAAGMNMIMTDFQFDVPLDDSLFTMTPPAGYARMNLELQADMAEVGEQDLIAFLRMWSSWTTERAFPPTLIGTELGKVAMQMRQEGKFTGSDPSGYDVGQQAQIMYRGMVFMGKLTGGSWRYAGQNVAFGDATTPIFWYQPEGSATWRVIYADLSVLDVAPEDLPK
ncbi:MAG: zf-HC2 domain-containing protein [Sedimentisphaerales bacterium]|nr:zf-HC2 domain-containing protein [Sedimentisphaerales bacterium]